MVSLQEQLLKAGLTNQKKVKRLNQEKTQQKKQERRAGVESVSETRLAALEIQQKQREQAREMNARRDAEAQQKAIQAQIVQMVQQHRQARGKGDVVYNFTHGNKIERIYVSPAVQSQLAAGQLVIIRLPESVELVPRIVADKIEERDASMVVRVKKIVIQPDEDDPYADYKIPDDFTW